LPVFYLKTYFIYYVDVCCFMYMVPFYGMHCLITVWGLSIVYLYWNTNFIPWTFYSSYFCILCVVFVNITYIVAYNGRSHYYLGSGCTRKGNISKWYILEYVLLLITDCSITDYIDLNIIILFTFCMSHKNDIHIFTRSVHLIDESINK
jgi:hypothetical protein